MAGSSQDEDGEYQCRPQVICKRAGKLVALHVVLLHGMHSLSTAARKPSALTLTGTGTHSKLEFSTMQTELSLLALSLMHRSSRLNLSLPFFFGGKHVHYAVEAI